MALTKKIELISNFGDTVVFNNAYFKIDKIIYSKDNTVIYVNCYKDKSSLNIKTETYSFIPILDGDNPFKQGYDYLKTLDEFKDAKDV